MTDDEKLVMLVRKFARWSCAVGNRHETYYSMAKDGLWEIVSLARKIERERDVHDAVVAEREECALLAEVAEPYQAADLIRARGRS